MKKFITTAGLMLMTGCPFAIAHEGPRVWIGADAGRIVTFTSDNDFQPSVYTPSRLFTTELLPFFGVFTNDFPGFEVRLDGQFPVPPQTTFGFDLTRPLLVYDATGDTFVPVRSKYPAQTPQLNVSRGVFSVVTGDGPVAGFNFFTHNAPGDHEHLFFTLLGDGVLPQSASPDDVYALSLTLRSNVLQSSDEWFLLLGKGFSENSGYFLDAVAAANRVLIPEPSGLVLLGFSAGLLLRRRPDARPDRP